MISACVITKNEEKNLPFWIASMKGIADELVVVDTGSTDATVELAKKAGARVYEIPWKDDFSAAKNAAIEKAKGDWIVFCDADETIPAPLCPRVKELIADAEGKPAVKGFFSALHNIDGKGKVASVYWVMRVFRNDPAIRYHGVIHEEITYSGKDTAEMVRTDAFTIDHTGYSAETSERKAQRNIALLEKAQKSGKSRPVDAYYFAQEYYGQGDYEKAVKYLRDFLKTGLVVVGNEERPYSMLAQSLICLGRDSEAADELRKAKKLYPNSAIFPWIAGEYAYEQKRTAEAEKELTAALELAQKQGAASELESRMPRIHYQLGQIAEARGDRARAIDCYDAALTADRYEGGALDAMIALLAPVDDVDLIEYLKGHYDEVRDAAFLVDHLPKERGKVEIYFRKKGKLPTSNAVLYRLTGYTGPAAAELYEDRTALACIAAYYVREGHEELFPLLPAPFQRALRHPVSPADYRARRRLRVFFDEITRED